MADDDRTPARFGVVTGSLGMATDWLSGAMLLGLSGMLFGFGHDGLQWMLGLMSGVMLAGILVTPHMRAAGEVGIVRFIFVRFGNVAGLMARLVATAAVALLMAANVRALALAAQVLGLGGVGASASAVLAVAAAFILIAGAIVFTPTRIAQLQASAFPLILAAVSMPIVLAVLADPVSAPSHLTYGRTLQAISQAELVLLEQNLADPVTLKAYLRPFTTATISSGLLLTLSLALGLMAMPHLLKRPAGAASGDGASTMPAAALLLILVAVLALPPVAATARLAVLTQLAGSDVHSPPATLLTLGGLGLARTCGSEAASAEAVIAACAAVGDAPARLRLDDIEITRDAVLLAAPLLNGQPLYVAQTLAVAVGLAALLAIAWLGVSLRSATDDVGGSARTGRAVDALFAVLAAGGGAALVFTSRADIMSLIAWAMALAAGGLAPVLLAGVWSRRATAAAAVLGIVTGAAATTYYIVATQFFPVAFYELWGGLSSAGYGVIADYEAARDALGAAGAAEREAARMTFDDAARAVANWWGLRDEAAGALGAIVASFVIFLVSLVTPKPGEKAVVTMSRMRRMGSRV